MAENTVSSPCVNADLAPVFTWGYPGPAVMDRAARQAARRDFDPADAEMALAVWLAETLDLRLDEGFFTGGIPSGVQEAARGKRDRLPGRPGPPAGQGRQPHETPAAMRRNFRSSAAAGLAHGGGASPDAARDLLPDRPRFCRGRTAARLRRTAGLRRGDPPDAPHLRRPAGTGTRVLKAPQRVREAEPHFCRNSRSARARGPLLSSVR